MPITTTQYKKGAEEAAILAGLSPIDNPEKYNKFVKSYMNNMKIVNSYPSFSDLTERQDAELRRAQHDLQKMSYNLDKAKYYTNIVYGSRSEIFSVVIFVLIILGIMFFGAPIMTIVSNVVTGTNVWVIFAVLVGIIIYMRR